MADVDRHEHGDSDCRDHRDGTHFLVVAYGLQGHLNPSRALARRLARVGAAVRVTLSVTVAAHGRMFPSLASPDEEVSDGLISYVPYSDGFGVVTRPRSADERARCRRESVESLSAIVRRLAAAGRPVTCVVSALFLPAVDVAVQHGIPLAVYCVQSAAAFAAFYHYFHGYEQLVASHVGDPTYEVSLPGLGPLRIRDFPSFLVDATGSEHSMAMLQWLRELFEHIGRGKAPKILMNTIDVLEATALQAMQQHLDVFAVGPMIPRLHQIDSTEDHIHLCKKDQKGYIEWLDAQPDRSVVYMSYGSMVAYNRQQVEEILQGLRECGRPYLWVVRKDGRDEEVERCLIENHSSEQGMILEWCDQLEVLSHPSVGCFVTHCGWNSTLEAITLGVPLVAVPNWTDQALNAHLVEDDWGVGVRAELNADGLLVATELTRCIEMVIGEGEKAANIQNSVKALKEKVQTDVTEVELSLQNFIKAMQTP
ncbi:hypothetical protein ACP70R_020090 [Stipagrostis hirtigluma subsp. patula]